LYVFCSTKTAYLSYWQFTLDSQKKDICASTITVGIHTSKVLVWTSEQIWHFYSAVIIQYLYLRSWWHKYWDVLISVINNTALRFAGWRSHNMWYILLLAVVTQQHNVCVSAMHLFTCLGIFYYVTCFRHIWSILRLLSTQLLCTLSVIKCV
jgi:hypothetical protein